MHGKIPILLFCFVLYVVSAAPMENAILADISFENEACGILAKTVTSELKDSLVSSSGLTLVESGKNPQSTDIVLQGSVISTDNDFRLHLSAVDLRTGHIAYESFDSLPLDAEKPETVAVVRRFVRELIAARTADRPPVKKTMETIGIGIIAGFPGAALSVKYHGFSFNMGGIYNVLFQTRYGILAEAGYDIFSGDIFPNVGYTLGITIGGFYNLHYSIPVVYARIPAEVYWVAGDYRIFAEISPALGTTFSAGGIMPVIAAGFRYIFR